MTRSETIRIIEIIRRAYPRFIEPSPLEPDIKKVLSGIVDLWAEMFADDPSALVACAVKRYIATGRFPPTIADIRAIITDMSAPGPSLSDVWDEAQRLLQSGIAPDDERTAYSRMSPACKAATVAAGGWYALSMTDDAYTRRSFIQAAKAFLDAERDKLTAPKAYLQGQGERPSLTGGEGCG